MQGVTTAYENTWRRILSGIESKISRQNFSTWIKPIKFISFADDMLVLEVTNRFHREWITRHYIDVIKEQAASITSTSREKIAIKIQVSNDSDNTSPGSNDANFIKEVDKRKVRSDFYLNPRYTFDTFVIGASNQFAHAACLAVAESPAKAYNPLFIYGGVGLGKTHLMQAVGHFVTEKRSQMRVSYLSSEEFTNQLISAIQTRSTPAFRNKFRNVDALLIDDIHFLAGKESTQEEFFHTFNALYDSHKQIVVSSDRPPKEIPTLEERLVSRFEWGLVTDIQPPDLETRIAILRKKAAMDKIHIPDEAAAFIGSRIKFNIRELEGALIKVAAFSSLKGCEISLKITEEALRDVLPVEKGKQITIDLIQRKVVDYFGLRPHDMKTKRRTKSIAFPRQIAMFLSRTLTAHSLPEIAENFGGRDHTTILHACQKIQQQQQNDEGLQRVIEELIQIIRE